MRCGRELSFGLSAQQLVCFDKSIGHVGEFGKVPPISSRNAFMDMLYKLVESSARSGHAIAGELRASRRSLGMFTSVTNDIFWTVL